MSDYTNQSLEYSRFLYEDIKYWYKNADDKAQILLTLMGVFIAFLTSSVFVKSDDLELLLDSIDQTIWVLLIIMLVTVALAVICGLMCLWSRVPIHKYAWIEPKKVEIAAEDQPVISGSQIGFFATLIKLDKNLFQSRFRKFHLNDEVDIRLEQTYYFSRNVYKKHILLDLGFFFAVASLLLFFFAGAFYIKNVANQKTLFCAQVSYSSVERSQCEGWKQWPGLFGRG
jgi:hypothetical protein